MGERRFYVRVPAMLRNRTYSPQIIHCDGQFHWPATLPAPEFRAEIPPRFWAHGLEGAIAYFERGEKPRLRVRLMDHRLPMELLCE